MLFLEYALAEPRNRNNILEVSQIFNLVNNHRAVPIYRSVYYYDDSINEYLRTTKSVRNFDGTRYIQTIPIDVDKGSNSDEYTLKKMRGFLDKLDDYGVNPEALQVFFSGTGYHIMITNEEFGFEPGSDLPYQVERTMQALGLAPDPSVLRKTAIIRMQHTVNLKSNRYKIPLTYEEATNMPVSEIHNLAKSPRDDYMYTKLTGRSTFVGQTIEVVKAIPSKDKVYNYDKVAHLKNYVCIQAMLNKGPVEGTRNNSILRIASHLKWSGIPEDAAFEVLKQWNSKTKQGVDTKVIYDKLSYVYNSAVKYSCQDQILQMYCRSTCVDFKDRHKETEVNAVKGSKLHDEYIERINLMSNTENLINLKYIFDLEHDCVLYPGELVTFIGDTGSNKTSILQNILIGYNMRTSEIRPHKQSILFYETELGGGGLYERFMSIITGLTAKQLRQQPEIARKHKSLLDNINIQTGLVTIQAIEEAIEKYQYDVVVIDYIEKIRHPLFERGQDYAAIGNIMRDLATMAQKHNVAIIVISQAPRSDTKEKTAKIGVHSGKGNSAIESSSRRVFAINGSPEDPYRNISMVKANNDRLFSGIIIERQDNWRFTRRG